MKLRQIVFTASSEIVFTKEEIDLCIDCAIHHYDGVCKAAAKPETGMLQRMRRFQENAPDLEQRLSWRELDTIAKILEVGHYLGIEQGQAAFGLTLAIRKTLNDMADLLPTPVFIKQI